MRRCLAGILIARPRLQQPMGDERQGVKLRITGAPRRRLTVQASGLASARVDEAYREMPIRRSRS
jgi:hypothetical protein